MIDLTPILEAVVMLLAALITYKLIPWIKANTSKKQQELLLSTTSILVFAAEQLYGAGHGDEKLDYVVRELEERGYTADRAAIEATIRDYVTELHTPKPVIDKGEGENQTNG